MGIRRYNLDYETSEEAYKDYAAEAKNMNELISHQDVVIPLCDELFAHITYRKIFNDRKIFSKSGSFYKPTEICVVRSNMRHQFHGIHHIGCANQNHPIIQPHVALRLLAAVESFLSNQLTCDKKYKETSFSFYFRNSGNENLLYIEYSNGLKESRLDKYRCRVLTTTLRNILGTCTYEY